MLTRRLQRDPELPGVAAVIFDEVHERNLTTDLGLALTLDVAVDPASGPAHPGDVGDRRHGTLRPPPRRPTARTRRRSSTVAGRAHPVDIRWLPRQRADRLEGAVEQAVLRALRENEGDVLVFLPGIGEILRCRERLVEMVGAGVDVRPLAGALSTDEQDLALAPSPAGRRRVVLATDIAETSLTVEGVRVIVDSGLARAPRFDAGHRHDPPDHGVDQP